MAGTDGRSACVCLVLCRTSPSPSPSPVGFLAFRTDNNWGDRATVARHLTARVQDIDGIGGRHLERLFGQSYHGD